MYKHRGFYFAITPISTNVGPGYQVYVEGIAVTWGTSHSYCYERTVQVIDYHLAHPEYPIGIIAMLL